MNCDSTSCVMVTIICIGANVLFNLGFDMQASFRVRRLGQLSWFVPQVSSHKIEAVGGQSVLLTIAALKVGAHCEGLVRAWY